MVPFNVRIIRWHKTNTNDTYLLSRNIVAVDDDDDDTHPQKEKKRWNRIGKKIRICLIIKYIITDKNITRGKVLSTS